MLHALVGGKGDIQGVSNTRHVAYTLLLFCSAVGVALATADLGVVMSVTGNVAGAVLGYLLPGLIGLSAPARTAAAAAAARAAVEAAVEAAAEAAADGEADGEANAKGAAAATAVDAASDEDTEVGGKAAAFLLGRRPASGAGESAGEVAPLNPLGLRGLVLVGAVSVVLGVASVFL